MLVLGISHNVYWHLDHVSLTAMCDVAALQAVRPCCLSDHGHVTSSTL